MSGSLTIVPWPDPVIDTIGAGMSLTQTREQAPANSVRRIGQPRRGARRG